MSRLLMLFLTSRTAGYATRTSGGAEGALSDERPYPYGQSEIMFTPLIPMAC
jgi:hypothetical protein